MIPNVGGFRFRAVGNGPSLLVSIALHAALLIVLLAFKPDGDSAASSVPRIVRVEVFESDGADIDSERAEDAQSTELSEPAVDIAEANAEPLDPTPRVARVEDPAPVRDTPPQPRAEPAVEETPALPPPRRIVVAEPDAEPAEAEPVDTAPAAAPGEQQLAVRDDDAAAPPAPEPAPEPAPAPSTAPPPETVSIVQRQRRMLDRKVAEWTKSFDELAPTVAWAHDGQAYTATFTRLPAADSMGIEQVLVAVTTAHDGSRWSTQMRMQRLSFSSFAQFVDRWDPTVQIHDDEIDGRFHSNSDIYVARSGGVQPAFHGKVTTARGINTTHSERRLVRSQVFLGGLETGAGRILLPRRFSLFGDDDSAADDERMHRFETSARITFHADGSFSWRELESAAPERRVLLSAEPHYLIGGEKAALHVRGVVNGKVLVYSPAKIVIEDDLTYAADPAAIPDADDYLGLVSDGNVEIAEPEITGPGDLTVHASIYAKRRFAVRNYRAHERATLFVYGSVTSGTLSATEPRYATSLDFDERLEERRPPRFPMTDRYEVAAWDGRWTETVQGEP